MPTFPEEFIEIVRRAELTPGHIVIMHPSDFGTLRMFVQREDLDPSFSVRPTIHGARVVSDGSHPLGFVTILNAGSPRHFIEQYREALGAHPGPAPPAEPEPRSLWERLDEDE